ncbi:MAG: hypothetical protein GX081_08450 [Firmicutes bacterium]|nr:hypothetical protein [Bacillota bacterium]
MKKRVFILLFLTLVLTCRVQVLAGEIENHQLLAEEILERPSGRGFIYEFAYLPQAYLLLEETLISDPDNYNAQGFMAEYLIQAPYLLGHHPKKAIKILENLPSFGDEEQDSLTACRLGRAYLLDGQREKALSALNEFLSIYEKNEAAKAELAKILAQVEKPFQVSFYPILPFNEVVLGAGVTAKYRQFSPNLSGSYDLSYDLFYYNLSAKYTFTLPTWAELGYFRESNSLHPGYHYQDGLKTQFTYDNGLGSYFNLALFAGEIGRGDKMKEPVNTQLATVFAASHLYDDWGKNLSYSFSATFGTVEKENYQVYRLRLPLRYHNYRGLLFLGHINQGREINMHFNNLVRGYGSDDREGVNLVLLCLERSFNLFHRSRKPFLGALQWRIFTDLGTVYNDQADFALQKSVGTGILYNTPLFDICLDLAFTEEGMEPVFAFVGKVF